jgi:DtxR family transcriptional regulator, Mn-dependent transcriptional regulator
MLSESMQDYLKTIYNLGRTHQRVTTNALAETLNIAAASVTGMVKKLAEMKLVEYEPYQGVTLTRAGEKIALEVLRHHRLLELYLTEALGYSWDRVHEEAERMEHAISEEFADKVSALLGDPKTDPHGAPIPSKDGHVAAISRLPLSDIPAGRTVQVERVPDEQPELLRHMAELGLVPRAVVTVVSYDANGEGLSILIRKASARRAQPAHHSVPHFVPRSIAQHVYVRDLAESDSES